MPKWFYIVLTLIKSGYKKNPHTHTHKSFTWISDKNHKIRMSSSMKRGKTNIRQSDKRTLTNHRLIMVLVKDGQGGWVRGDYFPAPPYKIDLYQRGAIGTANRSGGDICPPPPKFFFQFRRASRVFMYRNEILLNI